MSKALQTKTKCSLGEDAFEAEDLGAPAGCKPLSSEPIGTDLPGSQKAAQTAQKVRKLAEEAIPNAWKKLQDEFEVQRMVWESCAVVKSSQRKSEVQAMRDKLGAILPVQNPKDRQQSLASLEELTRALGQGGGVLSKGMLLAIKEVIRHEGLVGPRESLVHRLDRAVDPSTLPQSDAEKSEAEAFLESCQLGDPKIDRKIRQVLRLPAKEVKVGAAVSDVAALSIGSAVSLTPSRTLDQIMKGVIGAPTSRSYSNRSSSVGAAVGPGQTMSTNSTTSVYANAYLNMRAGTAAQKMRDLASNRLPGSWKSLKQELDVQKLVWQSLLLTRAKDKNLKSDIEGLQANIEKVVSLKSTDPEQALSLLQAVMLKSEANMSKSMRAAGMNVVKQHQMQPLRLKLSERIDVAEVPATLPKSDGDKRELEDLVVACDIEDPTLHCAVRHLMLLPLPSDIVGIGPAVGAKKTPSTGSQVSTRRSSSTGVLRKASRKESTKSQSGDRAAANKADFTPPARVIEAI